MEETYQKLRPVGLLERWCTQRHAMNFYPNVIVTSSYQVTACKLATLKPHLYGALGSVINTHPILSAIVMNEGLASAHFVRLPEIRLEDILSVHTVTKSRDLELLLESEHSRRFTTPGNPFWRLALLLPGGEEEEIEAFELMFIYHHVLGDGLSGPAFHRSLHVALASASPGPAKIPSPTAPLFKPLEDLLDFHVSLLVLIVALWRFVFPPQPAAGQWTGAPITPDPVTRVRILSLPTDVVTGFTSRCRAENASVTSALIHIVGAAFLCALPETTTELLFQAPISARRWLPPMYADVIGNWVTEDIQPYVHRRRVESANIWAAARATKARLEKTVQNDGRNTAVGLLPWIGDYDSYFASKVGTKRDVSVEISNLGVCREQRRVVFSQSAGVDGPAVAVSVAAAKEGMVLTFNWQQGVVEERVVAEVVRLVEVAVRRAVVGEM
ncbi:alcohol acetyltransferase [Sphaerosporella brunnea]|uniref:Alcohol acetyltransferase n=1 Tax=Sphaerosporella brunnea TaxID=1250544 RepID=A0A5J5EKE8_9PEZI|nr:alcohol acetyltransferase [Sphaerosporella brunnea]